MHMTPMERFRNLLWEFLDAVDVHQRTRPERDRRLADAQWNMLNGRFRQTFGPDAEFPPNVAATATNR